MKILIDTNWINFIQDLPQETQSELLLAIMDYPNRECNLNCWVKIIQPQLEKGKIGYFNRLQNLKQNRTDTDTDSDSVTEPTPNRTENEDIDIDNNKDILNKEVIKSFSARWNNNAQDYSNMTEIKVMSDARVKSLKERLKDLVSFCDADDIDPIDLFFEKVGEAYMESDFLQGRKGGFNFTIDFVLQKSSFIKLLEGSYKSGDKK